MKIIKNEDIDVLVTHGETCFHVFQQKDNKRKYSFEVMLPPFSPSLSCTFPSRKAASKSINQFHIITNQFPAIN